MGNRRLKIISHRGLLNGPDESVENNPKYILNTINIGFDIEIDVRVINGVIYLGHDTPDYNVDISFFNKNMWIHCKNLEAVDIMSKTDLNWFWHDVDKLTLTSKGFIWCYPNVYVQNGITVIKQKPEQIQDNVLGICTDYPLEWKKFIRS